MTGPKVWVGSGAAEGLTVVGLELQAIRLWLEMQIRALEGMERDDVLEALRDWFRRDLALDDDALMRLLMSGKWHARKAGRDVDNINIGAKVPPPELVS